MTRLPVGLLAAALAAGRKVPASAAATDRRSRLLEAPQDVAALLARTRRIAVIGIKTEAQSDRPAYYVPEYLAQVGFDVVPVPVYFPDVERILDRRVYRRLIDIPGEVDLVNLFRRSGDVPQHVDDILAKRPHAVWMQQGIRNDEVAAQLARAGIVVVQDRCIMVEHRRHRSRAG